MKSRLLTTINFLAAGWSSAESQRSTPMLSILMPAYNEASSIAENVCETVETMRDLGIDFEIIVVDDGSLDGTHAAASNALRAWPDHVRVVRCTRNEGKGNALTCGAAYSRGDYVAFLDADMDLHPEQLADFFAIMNDRKADAVIGSKFHPQSRGQLSAHAACLQLLLLSARTDAVRTCPCATRRPASNSSSAQVLDKVLPRILVKRFAFDLELLANIHHFGYRIVEAPVTLHFQRLSSRVRLPAVWNVFLDTLAIFYRMRILHYYDRLERPPATSRFRRELARSRRSCRHSRLSLKLVGLGVSAPVTRARGCAGRGPAASRLGRGCVEHRCADVAAGRHGVRAGAGHRARRRGAAAAAQPDPDADSHPPPASPALRSLHSAVSRDPLAVRVRCACRRRKAPVHPSLRRGVHSNRADGTRNANPAARRPPHRGEPADGARARSDGLARGS